MSRLRVIFIASLVCVAGVIVLLALRIPGTQGTAETRRVQLAQSGGGWILQYNITNDQQNDIGYHLVVRVNLSEYRDSFTIAPGKMYTYIFHVPPEESTDGDLTLVVYQDGKTEPIDEAHYVLKPSAK